MKDYIAFIPAIALLVSAFLYNTFRNHVYDDKSVSVHVCAFVNGDVYKCGTGVFTGPNTITTAFHVVSPFRIKDNSPLLIPQIMILRYGHDSFEPAVFYFQAKAVDLAVLMVSGDSRYTPIDSKYGLGDTVWAVGCPAGRDFVVVKTKIVGTIPIQRGDRKGLMDLISVDSMGGAITHGFSGGGIFNRSGMIGMIQMCESDGGTCWALPAKDIKTEENKIGEMK